MKKILITLALMLGIFIATGCGDLSVTGDNSANVDNSTSTVITSDGESHDGYTCSDSDTSENRVIECTELLESEESLNLRGEIISTEGTEIVLETGTCPIVYPDIIDVVSECESLVSSDTNSTGA